VTDIVQLVLGGLILWAPGLTWTWTLTEDLDWAKFLFVSVIVALSVQPAAMYLLNVFLSVPIAPMNYALLSMALAFLALAWGLSGRIDEAWA